MTVNFGDFLNQQNDFIEINIGNTARALSLDAVDLEEDRNADIDLVVGTPFSKGVGNMLVFHNNRRNAKTAIAALFDATPTYYRNAGHNVNTLRTFDFTRDGRPDVYTGLDYSTGNNLQIWFENKNGFLSNAPDRSYTSAQLTSVLSSAMGDFNEDGRKDIVLGLTNGAGTFTGAFQVFLGDGSGSFTDGIFVSESGAIAPAKLGEIWAIDAADVDGDGDDDIVVGSHDNLYAGFIDVYLNIGGKSGKFKWGARYPMPGAR